MSSAVIGINGLDQGPRSKFAFGGEGVGSLRTHERQLEGVWGKVIN